MVKGKKVKVVLERVRLVKNSVLFKSQLSRQTPPVLSSMYLMNKAYDDLGQPETIEVTIVVKGK